MLQHPFGPVLDGTIGIEKLKLSKANYGNVYNLINYTVYSNSYMCQHTWYGMIRLVS